MIDKKWVEDNIRDEEVKEFLLADYIPPEYENVKKLIEYILFIENKGAKIVSFKNYKDLDEWIKFYQVLSKTLKILSTFTD